MKLVGLRPEVGLKVLQRGSDWSFRINPYIIVLDFLIQFRSSFKIKVKADDLITCHPSFDLNCVKIIVNNNQAIASLFGVFYISCFSVFVLNLGVIILNK